MEYPEVSAALDPPAGDASNGWYTTPVQFTMTSTGFSAATREYRLDGGAWTTYIDPVTISAPGAHTLEYRGTNAAGTTEVRSLAFTIGAVTDTPGTVGGTVPATLSLTLGTAASFGAFTPGVARTYTASTTATVTSSAGDAALARRVTRATWSTGRSRSRSRCRSACPRRPGAPRRPTTS